MPAKIDITGMVFGRLAVLKEGERSNNRRMWDCSCSCGRSISTRGDSLRDGKVNSCGCLRNESLRTPPPTGVIFGELNVLGFGTYKNGRVMWEVKCTCGTIKDVRPDGILIGSVISCGCKLGVKHSLSHLKEYASVVGANKRCYSVKNISFPNYGGRGVTVCERWRVNLIGVEDSVLNFIEDMGHCPADHSLERVDVDGDYTKENCIWATREVQASNKRKYNNNTTGRTGVYRGKGIWRAKITHMSVEYDLGRFQRFEDAVKAREIAELKYFGFIKK